MFVNLVQISRHQREARSGSDIFPLLLLRINNEEIDINSIQASSILRLGEIVGSQVRWREQHYILGK